MIPIRDHNPSRQTAFVSYALIAINVIVFLTYFSKGVGEINGFFMEWGLVPAEVTQGVEYKGLLTTMFLHAGWMHLIGNMLFLYIFGDNLEDYFGHVGFLLFYLIGGLAASALHIYVDPNSIVPTVGASGAIAAVMGGYLLLFPKARVDVLVFLGFFVNVFALPAWLMLLIWFALQVGGGVVNLGVEGGGVAYWAHAGGFAAGLVLVGIAWMFGRRPARDDGHPAHPAVQYRMRKGPWG